MRNNRAVGSEYEKIARTYIEDKGYKLIESNYRCKQGEVDIIAKDKDYLVFIEVKYRSNAKKGSPIEAVDFRKQMRISKVARYYMYEKRLADSTPVRFDVIGILKTDITYIENAFTYIG